MIAILVFLFAWLGGGVATGSVSAGFHAAAVVFLWWSCFWTFIMFMAAITGQIKFTSFLCWGVLGAVAAYCLTLGGGQFIALGVVLWIISVVAEIRALPDIDEP